MAFSASITPAMQAQLLADRRTLCWFVWFEGSPADLYAWDGAAPISWGGHTWYGLGYLADATAIKKTGQLEHRTQSFTLNGLDPSILTALDSSVRGRRVEVGLGALDARQQVIESPFLVNALVQDTLAWERKDDDTISLTLNCYEALPQMGKVSNLKWSNQNQQAAYPGDVGFKYNTEIAQTTAPIDWVLGS